MQELQKIIDNKEGFQVEAVNAAIQLLNERKNTQITKLEDPKENILEQASDFDSLNRSLDLTSFLRTLSYRDFLTSFSLAVFFLAYAEILNYYSNERILEDTYATLQKVAPVVLMLINHIFYKVEHGRSNNFIGRVINDVIFIIMLIVCRASYSYILNSSHGISVEGNIVVIFFVLMGFVIMIFILESVVALIKRVLRVFKWQVF